MNQKVGIVIVSHNASKAVRITLASLRQSENHVSSKVLLIDNASCDLERETIRSAFERHIQEQALDWEFVQQEKNLGFSGGNNIGIRKCLDDPEITHICLLNSDVVVTDHWLDHLVETRCKIVSSVTNKADSEQCIPIDYTLEIDQCLDESNESVPSVCLDRIRNFSNNWRAAWSGNVVEADPTFFCVLISKRVFQEVGLLDETFFPGGFEDDDFCIRAHNAGFHSHIARDVFIHHWGSASFGQLQYDYFNGQAQRNLDYLQTKHNFKWRRRPEKPFLSYLMDLRHACSREIITPLHKHYNSLYINQLSSSLKGYESEFRKLHQMILKSGQAASAELQELLNRGLAYGNLEEKWKDILSEANSLYSGKSGRQSTDALLERLTYLIDGIHVRVECNFAMHSVLFPAQGSQSNMTTTSSPAFAGNKLTQLFWMIRRGIPFLWNLKGIVFFGGYPYPERQSDGYFQRIQIIDNLFLDRWRVYVESDELPGRDTWIDCPQPKILVLRITGAPYRRMLTRMLVLLAVLKCRKIYFHSVLRMRDNLFDRLMWIPWLSKAIDVHGVVPEEFRFHNDFYSAGLYDREERLAVRKSDLVIVVTEAMKNYLRQKYRDDLRGKVAIFPMFPSMSPTLAPRAYVDGKPVVVYAGGLHKWQQVPKMIDAIVRTSSICAHRFYCPEPDVVRAMLPESVRPDVIVDRKAHEELVGLYSECHYGFILREDIVVNHVACPTKLVEYLAMGIVPIIDCEEMGDFKTMGLQSVPLNDFLQAKLPTEMQRTKMAEQNFAIYKRLHEVRKQGAHEIYEHFSGGLQFSSLLNRVKGRFSTNVDASIPAGCDILVQVDNFEAGGLENVALDLNSTLIDAGYAVVLLVLGTAGEAVKRARALGMTVVIGSPEKKRYLPLLEQLKPRLVLTHYSIHGAELCHDLNIPFVQIIHNTYMWFDYAQREAFAHAARYTTAFVAVSEYAKRYSVRRLGIDERRCIVIPNGIDCKAFDTCDVQEARLEIRAKHGLNDEDFVFLSIGAINHQKNHIASVRAFAHIADKLPMAKLVIVGPTYEKGLLEDILRYIEERSLGKRIIYAGSTASPQKYYAMADAFVTASFFEGGPLNQLEALKANLPSIMAEIGFASYFIGFPGCEVVVPELDIAEYNGTIWQLASSEEFELRLAKAMQRTYQKPLRPNLPAELLAAFDKSSAYRCYVEFIGDLMQGKDVDGINYTSTWPNQLISVRQRCINAW